MGTVRSPRRLRHLWRRWMVVWGCVFEDPDADPTSEELALFISTYIELRHLGCRFSPELQQFMQSITDPDVTSRTDAFVDDATDSDEGFSLREARLRRYSAHHAHPGHGGPSWTVTNGHPSGEAEAVFSTRPAARPAGLQRA